MIRLTTRLTALVLALATVFLLVQAPVRAGEMTVYADDGDKISVLGDIHVDEATHGDIVAILGNIEILDDVEGDVVSILGNVTIDAKVSGEVVTVLGKVKLGEKAEIGRDIITIGNLEKLSGARINGQEVRINTGMLTLLRALSTFVFAFFVLFLGLAIITLLRNRFENISFTIEQEIGKKLVIGLLGFFGLLILLILLFITVIFPLLYLVLLVIAETTACIYFGKLLLKVFGSSSNVYLQFVIGLLCITFIKMVLVLLIPEIGFIASSVLYGLASMMVYSLGLGILIDSKAGAAGLKSWKG